MSDKKFAVAARTVANLRSLDNPDGYTRGEAQRRRCLAVLNAVSVPLGESPAKGEWSQTSIQRCREALMNARAEIE